jgi:MFS family permease
VPMVTVFGSHAGALVLGTVIGVSVYVIFYLTTVFALSWGTTALGYTREQFLIIQLVGVVFFAITVPISALLAEGGRRRMLMWVNVAIAAFGLVLAPLFQAGTVGAVVTMIVGFALVGMAYGPIGTVLAELFPTAVRYTGSSLTYNFAGIVGASLAPYIATWLATTRGLQWVGYYLSASALLSLLGLYLSRETRDTSL